MLPVNGTICRILYRSDAHERWSTQTLNIKTSFFFCISYLPTYLSGWPAVHPPLHLSVCLPTHLSVYTSTCISVVNPSVCPTSTYLTIHSHMYVCLSTYSLICPPMYLSFHLSIHQFIHLPIYLFNRSLLIYRSVCLSSGLFFIMNVCTNLNNFFLPVYLSSCLFECLI